MLQAIRWDGALAASLMQCVYADFAGGPAHHLQRLLCCGSCLFLLLRHLLMSNLHNEQQNPSLNQTCVELAGICMASSGVRTMVDTMVVHRTCSYGSPFAERYSLAGTKWTKQIRLQRILHAQLPETSAQQRPISASTLTCSAVTCVK